MTLPVQNVFNNPAAITTESLDVLRNGCQIVSRVARRWDGDFAGTTKIGNTLSMRQPGFYKYRSGAVAAPQGFNDSYTQVTLAQGGCDIELTGAEMSLNVNDFAREVIKPMMAGTIEEISVEVANQVNSFSQFAGAVGGTFTDLSYFLDAKATMQLQSAVHEDGKLHGFLNPRSETGIVGGLKSLLLPTKEITEQYRLGTMGSGGGYDFFSSANVPSFTLGTWSGSMTVNTCTTAADGTYSTIAITGQTGSFAVGECLTIVGCHAVNPASKNTTADLKHFRVKTSSNGSITVTPGMIVSGPLQNVDALPGNGAAIYPWGVSAGTALASGTGQVLKTSAAYHEDAIVFAMADLEDMSATGARSKRMKDEETGLRVQTTWGYDPIGYKGIFRIDLLWATNTLRAGFGVRVIQ